ncbi:MAG: hypothetical protein IKR27_08790 [Lachnospiraceae bacterium]|nr:hypothetical protein [Lachnospiraceae bacterium]MBR6275085.1 hypothetical protein [Lachnospiraceae bacterium]
MINVRKTRLMAKCAGYENAEGAEDIRMSRYFRADYVRLNFLKTVFYTAIGFFTVCLLYAIVRYDSFIDDVFEIDYEKIGMLVGLVFLAVLVGSLILTWLVYTIKYIRSRKRLAAYYRMLRQINIFNEEDMQLKKLEDK